MLHWCILVQYHQRIEGLIHLCRVFSKYKLTLVLNHSTTVKASWQDGNDNDTNGSSNSLHHLNFKFNFMVSSVLLILFFCIVYWLSSWSTFVSGFPRILINALSMTILQWTPVPPSMITARTITGTFTRQQSLSIQPSSHPAVNVSSKMFF